MRELNSRNYLYEDKQSIKLLPIIGLWAFVLIAFISLITFFSDGNQFVERPYLIPWTFAAGIVVAAPGFYLWTKKQFCLYHPLIFPACFYFIPSFFIGGLILIFGLNDPYFLSFVQDQPTNLPFTMLLIILGFAGLTAGFFVTYASSIGGWFRRKLPVWNWETENLFFPGLILLALGIINNIIGFLVGILGFQRLDQINSYDGLIFLSSLFFIEGAFLLWMALFRRNKLDAKAAIIAGILLSTALVKALFAGNRGGLLQVFILILLSYIFAGKIIKLKQGIILGAAMFTVVIVGMIYGTTFRNIKGTESSVGATEYAGYIGDTFDRIGSSDNSKVLEQGFSTLTERLEAVSSLAVVASNYEQLKPYEESYGLDNNIYKDTMTFFIPRIVWKDKPVASEPRKYSELYFDYGENSFTVTPMGDLLRNFGVWGVPLGMFVLGFLIRVIYSALIENQAFSYWRSTMFYMVVTGISYEGFFGTIVPYMIKTGFITLIGLLIVHFFIKKNRSLNAQ